MSLQSRCTLLLPLSYQASWGFEVIPVIIRPHYLTIIRFYEVAGSQAPFLKYVIWYFQKKQS